VGRACLETRFSTGDVLSKLRSRLETATKGSCWNGGSATAVAFDTADAHRQMRMKQRMGSHPRPLVLHWSCKGSSPRPSPWLMSPSPTAIIAGLCLRHRKVRRVHDWISVSLWLGCFVLSPLWPLSESHRNRSIASKLHLLDNARDACLAEGPRSASLWVALCSPCLPQCAPWAVNIVVYEGV